MTTVTETTKEITCTRLLYESVLLFHWQCVKNSQSSHRVIRPLTRKTLHTVRIIFAQTWQKMTMTTVTDTTKITAHNTKMKLYKFRMWPSSHSQIQGHIHTHTPRRLQIN